MSIIPSDLEDALGKTVVGFVVMEGGTSPRYQIHIVFSDNSSIELWGMDMHVTTIRDWDIDQTENYAKKFSNYVWRVE